MEREHYETYADDSPRGEKYLDDRTELAYAYDGEELLAIAYKEKVVREWLDRAWFSVSLTPAGEERCADYADAPEQNGGGDAE